MYKKTHMWGRLRTKEAKNEYISWVTIKMSEYPKYMNMSDIAVTNYLNQMMSVHISQKLIKLDESSAYRSPKQLRAAEAVKKTLQWYRNILTGTK